MKNRTQLRLVLVKRGSKTLKNYYNLCLTYTIQRQGHLNVRCAYTYTRLAVCSHLRLSNLRATPPAESQFSFCCIDSRQSGLDSGQLQCNEEQLLQSHDKKGTRVICLCIGQSCGTIINRVVFFRSTVGQGLLLLSA